MSGFCECDGGPVWENVHMGENLVKKKDQKMKSLSDSTFYANSKINTNKKIKSLEEMDWVFLCCHVWVYVFANFYNSRTYFITVIQVGSFINYDGCLGTKTK